MEWINPKYADLVKAMRQAQAKASRQDPPETRPVRGFIVPESGTAGPLPR
ncbi:hypothetical protein JBE04_33805 [Streptomyces sp. PRKS01-29]|nr:hypothetical protein [Streptomyces sabulosicollis]MBI0299301.1 hypothetical protein [Streptomyces sabulosicollis]